MGAVGSGQPDATSQLIFLGGTNQVCVTSALSIDDLSYRVHQRLGARHSGIDSGAILAQLIHSATTPGSSTWTPVIGHVTWDLPWVRVSSHPNNRYAVTSSIDPGSAGLTLYEPPEAKRPRLSRLSPAPPIGGMDATQIVFHSLAGGIALTIDGRLEVVSDILLGHLQSLAPRGSMALIIGAMFADVSESILVRGVTSVTLTPTENHPQTIWVRHLSGSTFAYSEGLDPSGRGWTLIGREFAGRNVAQHLVAG